ncbi:ABC transporter permease subunit [Ectothiorhodospiraceae bacterium WFHF3C12]|nr:ABC transporter permease subunit [Ectothiorhodospiraceae bacterium WFHF3C12]
MWLIAGRELRGLLAAPSTWLLAALSQFLLAWYFMVLLDRYRIELQPRLVASNSALGVTDLVIAPFLGGMPLLVLLVLAAALLAMGTVASERRGGTLALLLSAPLASWRIVLGKYLGTLAVVAGLLTLWWLMPLSLMAVTAIDPLRLLLALLALWLFAAVLVGVVLFASACTEVPAVAAMSGFAAGLFLLLFARTSGVPGGVLDALSATAHLRPLLEGRLSSADVVYFLLAAGLFIVLAVLRLRQLRGVGA